MAFLLVLGAGIATGFHVGLNDFWGLLYYGRSLDQAPPESLYNAFYPVGYAALLHFAPDGRGILAAYLMNALGLALLVGSVGWWLGETYGPKVAVVAALAVCAVPVLFQNAVTPGPDMAAAGLTALAVAVAANVAPVFPIAEAGSRVGKALLVGAGICLGLSTLLRSHCLVSSLAVLLLLLIVRSTDRWRSSFWVAAPLVLLYSLQVWIHLASGHGAFETGQHFNVYRLNHNIDWYDPPREVPSTLWTIIADDPLRFGWSYAKSLVKLMVYALPATLGLVLCRGESARRFCGAAAVAFVVYSVPVALGSSPRAVLPLAILVVAPAMMVLFDVAATMGAPRAGRSLGSSFSWKIGLFVVGLVGVVWGVSRNVEFVSALRNDARAFRSVESLLRDAGLKESTEVFTDSFDLYFPASSTRPLSNGGWGRYSLWGFDEQHPNLAVSSAAAFMDSAREQGVRFLVLTRSVDALAPFFGDVYERAEEADERAEESDEPFRFIGQVESFRVFRIEAAFFSSDSSR